MSPATHQLRIAFAACAALALTGCPTLRMPQLAGPGSAGYQRSNALQFDPYPLDDVAPPVAGGRPREYDRPIPEVKRGQIFTPKRLSPPPIAVQSFGPPASNVVTAPPAMPTMFPPATQSTVSMPPVVTTTPTYPSTIAPAAPPAYGLPYQTPQQSAPYVPPSSTLARPPY